jgi:hypothetical protein
MSFLGNFFLTGATLFLCGLLYYLLFTKMPGGDARVGHAWVVMILALGFFACMTLVTAVVGQKGGFAWIGSSPALRFFGAAGGFLLTMWGFYYYSEPGIGLPKALRVFGLATLALLLLIQAAVHLNAGLQSLLPAGAPKTLTILAFAFGLAPLTFAFGHRLALRVQMYANRGEPSDFEKGILANIDTTDVQKQMAFLLVHTPKGRHPLIRERALAKIKSRPDWQEKLVELLKTDWAPDVLGFLADNEVDNKALFPAAVHEGILMQARAVRENIRACNHPSNLYAGLGYFEVATALKVVRVFKDTGVDYRPAVQELRKAFDERSPYDKPKFSAIDLLDKWLAR